MTTNETFAKEINRISKTNYQLGYEKAREETLKDVFNILNNEDEIKNYYALMEFCKHNIEAKDRLIQIGRFLNKLKSLSKPNSPQAQNQVITPLTKSASDNGTKKLEDTILKSKGEKAK